MDEQMSQGVGAKQQVPELRLNGSVEAFTLVIELDAWNIRERNDEDWGQTEELRKKGQEPDWWHWVYGGTCFRLSQRVQTPGGRSLILGRGTVMTRGGIDALKQQLWAEAMRAMILQLAFRKAKLPRPLLIVRDGQEAVDYLSGNAPYADRSVHPLPALVVLDLKMPRMNDSTFSPGWQCTPNLSKFLPWCSPPPLTNQTCEKRDNWARASIS
jgi:CheY-like chemotaxis protein